MMSFDPVFALTLGLATLWTTLLSLTNRFPLRGFRNFGLLACYLAPVVFLFIAGFKAVFWTWLGFALMGGLLYTVWEIYQNTKAESEEDKERIGLGTLASALLAWPLMFPEAVEYILAEAGLLKDEQNVEREDRETGEGNET